MFAASYSTEEDREEWLVQMRAAMSAGTLLC